MGGNRAYVRARMLETDVETDADGEEGMHSVFDLENAVVF